MSDEIDITFELDSDAALEGMTLAGQRAYRGRGRPLQVVMYVMLLVVTPLGFIGVYVLAYHLSMGEPPRGPYWFAVCYVLGAGLSIWSSMAIYVRLATIVTTSRFGKGGRMICDDRGVQLLTDNSTWQTGWGDVEEVLLGKKSLSIAVSGIVLILPLSAFADLAEMGQVHGQLQGWFDAAGGPA